MVKGRCQTRLDGEAMRDKARGDMAASAAGSRLMVATYGIREWDCILLGFGPDNVREIAVDGTSRRVARTSPRLRWQLAMDENNRQGAGNKSLVVAFAADDTAGAQD